MEAQTLFEQSHALILASEKWAPGYKDDPESFGKLVKAEAKMNSQMLLYFKELANRAPDYVNWTLYEQMLRETQAASDPYQVDVIVEEVPDLENGLVMQIMFDPIAAAVTAGVLAYEAEYKIILPQDTITTFVTDVSNKQLAYLVGKKVDKFGNITDNPRADYRISDVTRDAIRQSIRTSLNLGKDRDAATKDIMSIIKDPKRADKIASTEAVNGYQGGQLAYALETGAVQKEVRSLLGACRICSYYASLGPVPIDYIYDQRTGKKAPSFHPWDRCGLRYIYQEELDGSN